jgi:hypothetical protein
VLSVDRQRTHAAGRLPKFRRVKFGYAFIKDHLLSLTKPTQLSRDVAIKVPCFDEQ